MSRGRLIALVVVATALVAVAAFGGFAAAGGFEKSSERVVSDATIQRGVGFYPYVHAQAFVGSDGTAYRAWGFGIVTHPGTGTYCLRLPKGVKAAAYAAIVSPEYSLSPNVDISAQWRSSSEDCPSTRWVEVVTFSGGWTYTDEAFSVIVP